MKAPSLQSQRNAGFTLIEMLTVVCVITLLGSVTALSLNNRESAALRATVDTLAAQVQSARSLSALKNASCRLIIQAGPGDKSGRRVALAIPDESDSTQWKIASLPVNLPANTYLVISTIMPSCTRDSSNANPDTMTLDGKTWYYYEFDPTGTTTDNAGARLVIATGRYDSTSNSWKVLHPEQMCGMFLPRSGAAQYYQDLDQLKQSYQQ